MADGRAVFANNPPVAPGYVRETDQIPTGEDPPPTLWCHGLRTGEQAWSPIDLGVRGTTPVLAGDAGYVGGYGEVGVEQTVNGPGVLAAFDPATGEVGWRRETAWWQAALAADGDGTVVACGAWDGDAPRGRVQALDAESGAALWTVETPAAAESLALVGETVFVGTRDGTLYALQSP